MSWSFHPQPRQRDTSSQLAQDALLGILLAVHWAFALSDSAAGRDCGFASLESLSANAYTGILNRA